MSEDQYYNIVEMIGKMGELVTANLSAQMHDMHRELTEKIEKVDSEVAVLGGRMDDLTQDVKDLTHRMDDLTQDVKDLTQDMKDLTQDMKDLTHYTKRRIEVIEFRQQSTDARTGAIEVEIHDIKAQLNQPKP